MLIWTMSKKNVREIFEQLSSYTPVFFFKIHRNVTINLLIYYESFLLYVIENDKIYIRKLMDKLKNNRNRENRI